MTIIGAGYGIGKIGSSAVESMARQPEVAGQIQTAMIIAAALIEGVTFFALIICIGGNGAAFPASRPVDRLPGCLTVSLLEVIRCASLVRAWIVGCAVCLFVWVSAVSCRAASRLRRTRRQPNRLRTRRRSRRTRRAARRGRADELQGGSGLLVVDHVRDLYCICSASLPGSR